MNGTPLKKKPVRNQFGDYEDTSNMSCNDWDDRWRKNQTQFHMGQVHPMLQKHHKSLNNGKPNLRVYVPLCGKSMDLDWLCNQGYDVVGSECSAKGVKEFFNAYSMDYTKENIEGIDGEVYKAKDRNITIYRCDFFDLVSDIVGQFDCIWDRGSLVAIPVNKRAKYADIITPMMTNSTRYLLDSFLVNHGEFAGPPFNCTKENVVKLFEKCNVDMIDERNALSKLFESWGMTTFTEQVYLLRLK